MFEIALPFRGDAFRVVYAVQIADEIGVVHAFQKKSPWGRKTPKREIGLIRDRLKRLKEILSCKAQGWKLYGGVVTRSVTWGTSMRMPDNLKPSWRLKSSRRSTREGLSVRGAQSHTGIAAADFSRIRNADLGRFTVDRLMAIINRLGSRVEVKIKVRRSKPGEHRVLA